MFKIDPTQKFNLDTNTLLIHLDPFSNDKITFSSCVAFLSDVKTILNP